MFRWLSADRNTREDLDIDTIFELWCTVSHMTVHGRPLRNTESHVHCVNKRDTIHATAQSFHQKVAYNTHSGWFTSVFSL